jgi:hypothetical protein
VSQGNGRLSVFQMRVQRCGMLLSTARNLREVQHIHIESILVRRSACDDGIISNVDHTFFSLALNQQEILLRESEFCLAPVSGESGTDTCYGDAGVPVVKQLADGSFVLVGLSLSGTALSPPFCASPGDYGIYLNVLSNRDWINSVLNGQATPISETDSLEGRVLGSFILVYVLCGLLWIVALLFSIHQFVARHWIECMGCFLVSCFAIVRVIAAALLQAVPASYELNASLTQTTGIWIIGAYGCVLMMW